MKNIIDLENHRKKSKQKQQKQPFFKLPMVTKYMLTCILIGYILQLPFVESRLNLSIYQNFAFTPVLWTNGNGLNIFQIFSPITYQFIHASMTHIIMNAGMLMAFGAGVEKWMGGKKFFLFFLLCGIGAAATELIIHPFSQYPIVGASGSESGLFAAILILMQRQGRIGHSRYGILPFALLWVGVSFIFAFIGGSIAGGEIAWAAHLGGFVCGFLLMKLRYFNPDQNQAHT